jgi:hypothetical protein
MLDLAGLGLNGASEDRLSCLSAGSEPIPAVPAGYARSAHGEGGNQRAREKSRVVSHRPQSPAAVIDAFRWWHGSVSFFNSIIGRIALQGDHGVNAVSGPLPEA